MLRKRPTGGIELLSSYAGSSTKLEFEGIRGRGRDIGNIWPTIMTWSAAASLEHHIREKGCDVIWTRLGLLSSLPRFPKTRHVIPFYQNAVTNRKHHLWSGGELMTTYTKDYVFTLYARIDLPRGS